MTIFEQTYPSILLGLVYSPVFTKKDKNVTKKEDIRYLKPFKPLLLFPSRHPSFLSFTFLSVCFLKRCGDF